MAPGGALVDEPTGEQSSFGPTLRALRLAAGVSQGELARRVAVDSGYISRLEAGGRQGPTRATVSRLADALGLGWRERDRLLAAAGYLPPSLARLGLDDPTLRLVLDLLLDPAVDELDRAEFRQVVALIGRRWRRGATERDRRPLTAGPAAGAAVSEGDGGAA